MIDGQMTIFDVLEDNPVLKPTMWSWLLDVLRACEQSGDPDTPFFYLGGPMRNKPFFNFREFDRVASVLRGRDYNVVSPAELDDAETREAVFASPDGKDARISNMAGTFLERDLVICSMPNCVGGIFLEGWEASTGAQMESFVISKLGRPIYAYSEVDGEPVLEHVDRDEALLLHAMSFDTFPVLADKAEDEAFEELMQRNGYEGAR